MVADGGYSCNCPHEGGQSCSTLPFGEALPGAVRENFDQMLGNSGRSPQTLTPNRPKLKRCRLNSDRTRPNDGRTSSRFGPSRAACVIPSTSNHHRSQAEPNESLRDGAGDDRSAARPQKRGSECRMQRCASAYRIQGHRPPGASPQASEEAGPRLDRRGWRNGLVRRRQRPRPGGGGMTMQRKGRPNKNQYDLRHSASPRPRTSLPGIPIHIGARSRARTTARLAAPRASRRLGATTGAPSTTGSARCTSTLGRASARHLALLALPPPWTGCAGRTACTERELPWNAH